MRFAAIRGTRGTCSCADMLIQLFLSCRQPPTWTVFGTFLSSPSPCPFLSRDSINILLRDVSIYHHKSTQLSRRIITQVDEFCAHRDLKDILKFCVFKQALDSFLVHKKVSDDFSFQCKVYRPLRNVEQICIAFYISVSNSEELAFFF